MTPAEQLAKVLAAHAALTTARDAVHDQSKVVAEAALQWADDEQYRDLLLHNIAKLRRAKAILADAMTVKR
jgi:predicted negative regulator of RcsB-dependent stress response